MRSQQLLELNQSQQLILHQQQYHALRLLQYSAAELAAEIDQAIIDNPLLERPEPSSATEQLERYWSAHNIQSNDDIPETADTPGLITYLFEQLRMSGLSQQQNHLVSILIGELDDQGYLSTELDWDELNQYLGIAVAPAQWQAALDQLQSFEPKGIGARGLAESLKLQLASRADELAGPDYDLAYGLLDYLPDVAAGYWTKLADVFASSKNQLLQAYALIQQLDPRPVANWDHEYTSYIVPDVLFYSANGIWQVSLNPSLSHAVRINQELMAQIAGTSLSEPMRAKVKEAQSFVRGIQQRGQTILQVAQLLSEYQRDYLELGMQALKPLRLADIAIDLELHISTISRAVRLKYAQTPWGLIELKKLFSNAASSHNPDVSAAAMRTKIQALIAEEPSDKPYSDMQLVELLKNDGIDIARRTISKYREQLGIKSSYMRKI